MRQTPSSFKHLLSIKASLLPLPRKSFNEEAHFSRASGTLPCKKSFLPSSYKLEEYSFQLILLLVFLSNDLQNFS